MDLTLNFLRCLSYLSTKTKKTWYQRTCHGLLDLFIKRYAETVITAEFKNFYATIHLTWNLILRIWKKLLHDSIFVLGRIGCFFQ
jgi:hypothetical protein